MYGDKPDRWDEALEGAERLRYIVNCFTRLRYVDEDGRLELRAKGSPEKAAARRADSVVRGARTPAGAERESSSAIGRPWVFQNADVIGLDTGCVWGGSLTALRLDVPNAVPIQVGCQGSGAGD